MHLHAINFSSFYSSIGWYWPILVAGQLLGQCCAAAIMRRRASPTEVYQQMAELQSRVGELLTSLPQQRSTPLLIDKVFALVESIERAQLFPKADYVFERNLLTPRLAQMIEGTGKHWIGQLPSSRTIQWEGPWQRLGLVAARLQQTSPQSFRTVSLRSLDGTNTTAQVFTRSIHLDFYGRKRLVIAHTQADLSDSPLFLFTNALHWEGQRIIEAWQYRWTAAMFSEGDPSLPSEE